MYPQMHYVKLYIMHYRMSKTDLRIRLIYHRLRNRIEAHICISFTAYCIYKELERVLYKEKSTLSLKKSAELTHNMYQITYALPKSKHTVSKLLKMDDQQAKLHQIIFKYFQGIPTLRTGMVKLLEKDIQIQRLVLVTYSLEKSKTPTSPT